MAEAADFADTAALIAGLDLVISVDSAVAHLAAAMGKEVWLLSRFVGCWRWLRNRADSPVVSDDAGLRPDHPRRLGRRRAARGQGAIAAHHR